MARSLDVLLVEDSPDDAELLERALRKAGFEPRARRVDDEASLRRALGERTWELVVSDYVLPTFDGLAALEVVKEVDPDVPFVISSGKIDEEIAVAAMRAGADDYVTKGNLARLGPVVGRELADASLRREQRRMEARLRSAERMELAGRVAAQVAHDLLNILTPLTLQAQLLQKRLEPEHRARRHADAIGRGLRRLTDLGTDLLTLGRRRLTQNEPVDVDALVAEAVSQLEGASGIEIVVEHAAEDPRVQGAYTQLLRAVSNLLVNAREAMPEGGILRVRTDLVEGGLPEQTACVRIQVSDSGPGIPAELLERIFDPFFTTKLGRDGGSGLGLAIVQAVVTDHGGRVVVESAPGRGTTFGLLLPAR